MEVQHRVGGVAAEGRPHDGPRQVQAVPDADDGTELGTREPVNPVGRATARSGAGHVVPAAAPPAEEGEHVAFVEGAADADTTLEPGGRADVTREGDAGRGPDLAPAPPALVEAVEVERSAEARREEGEGLRRQARHGQGPVEEEARANPEPLREPIDVRREEAVGLVDLEHDGPGHLVPHPVELVGGEFLGDRRGRVGRGTRTVRHGVVRDGGAVRVEEPDVPTTGAVAELHPPVATTAAELTDEGRLVALDGRAAGAGVLFVGHRVHVAGVVDRGSRVMRRGRGSGLDRRADHEGLVALGAAGRAGLDGAVARRVVGHRQILAAVQLPADLDRGPGALRVAADRGRGELRLRLAGEAEEASEGEAEGDEQTTHDGLLRWQWPAGLVFCVCELCNG